MMRLPSKVTSYNESVLSKFPIILKILSEYDKTPLDLYSETKEYFNDIPEYMDTLDCLFALGEIVFNEKQTELHYVK
ncbi:MAG: hypothetical protein J6W29_04740 [Neisseriaceae bacterium]|nr:hypothetical protein [Neisseriaceae bacterium]